jgi:signal transduction histidine kinase/ActR/RegA family two-component response regulator
VRADVDFSSRVNDPVSFVPETGEVRHPTEDTHGPPAMTRPHFATPRELAQLDSLATSVWVFDVARHRMWWANRAALEFWQAASVAELVARDFSGDSAAVRQRLRQILDASDGSGTVQDTWTLYPRNEPRTVVLSIRPVTIDSGQAALLLEVVRFVDMPAEAEALRLLEAIRATTLMISSFTLAGRLLTQNPQALAAHGVAAPEADALAARLGDPVLDATLRAAVARDEALVREVEVRTLAGPRTHRITARRGRDPVTAEPVIVLGEEDVTEQVQLRAQLQSLNARLETEVRTRTAEAVESRRRLENVIDGARIPTWEMEIGSLFCRVNEHWLNLVGLPPDTPLVLPPGWHERIHPDDRRAMFRRAHQPEADGRVIEDPIRLRHEDGRWLHVIARWHVATRSADGRPERVVGVNVDITALVDARDRIQQAEAHAQLAHTQLRDAVEALPDGFALFDGEDRLILSNRRYSEIYAISAPGIYPGARFEDILRYGLDRGQYAAAIGREEDWLRERLDAHKRAESVLQELPDGTVMHVSEQRTQGGGWVGLRVDITELHRARQRAEAANRAKSAFLANMSYELRTPMNGILGMAEILAASRLEPEQAAMLSVIRDAGDALLTILNDILDLARIEAGKMRLDLQPFVPATEARRWKALHLVTARAKGVDLVLRLGPGMDLPRNGDAGRIGQIANNLIGNALKFTPAGSVTVDLDTAGPDRLRLTVADTGIGMRPEDLSRVFEEFEQADTSVTRSFPGAGLGLSIVQKLAGLMDGAITADSAPGRGTTITVHLTVPRLSTGAPAPQPAPPPPRQFPGLAVLIADDNRTNLTILTTMLRGLGAEVTSVGNGSQALQAFRAGGFDVVFLDISMPVMDGVEALHEIRRTAQGCGLPLPPIIAATAHAQSDQADVYRKQGFDAVLTKPFSASRIAEILTQTLPAPEASGLPGSTSQAPP